MKGIERLVYGLPFVPAFKALVAEANDLSIAILLTVLQMFPFRGEDGEPFNPGSGLPGHHVDRLLFVMLFIQCIGALIDEIGQLVDVLFKDAGENAKSIQRSVAARRTVCVCARSLLR
jgi:hypothetical protein